jgi:hypothetical protein
LTGRDCAVLKASKFTSDTEKQTPRNLAGFLPIQPSRGLLAFQRVLEGVGRLPAATVVGSLSWPALLKAAARGRSPLFAEFRADAGGAAAQKGPEGRPTAASGAQGVDVHGELEAILAGVLGEKVGQDQPLMEVGSVSLFLESLRGGRKILFAQRLTNS